MISEPDQFAVGMLGTDASTSQCLSSFTPGVQSDPGQCDGSTLPGAFGAGFASYSPLGGLGAYAVVSDAAGGLVARAAARLLQKADRERSGVVSSAQSYTHFLDSPRMTRVMRQSTIDLATLKREPTSIYLVLPTDRLEAYARWLRIMIACALSAPTYSSRNS